jgi:hypothetical protein
MTTRLQHAYDRIDAANAEDPNQELVDGELQPKEFLYGRRMSEWLERLRPEAPEALRIAARAQHIRRWESPRDSYPMDRTGYLTWRKQLYKFHADTTAAILEDVGYGAETIERVRFLIQKKQLTRDPDSQSLEDAACLVFLQYHFPEFAAKTEEEKMINILRRTWGKMSEPGHQAALGLDYPPECMRLIENALAGE